MSDIYPSPGLGLFFGSQDRSNAIENEPPRPYLIRLDAQVAARAWYAGHQGVRAWSGHDLFLDFFVDPKSRLMFAQPGGGEAPERRQEWFAQEGEAWTFDDARKLSRWLRLYAAHVTGKTPRKKLVPRLPEFWVKYLDGNSPDCAPVALGLPRAPDKHFADMGWVSWEDWSWEPPKKRDKKATAKKKDKKPRAVKKGKKQKETPPLF